MVCTEYTYQDMCICMLCQYVCINVTVELLATLTKMVISPALSKISPEASVNTAKPTKFHIKQMEMGKFHG